MRCTPRCRLCGTTAIDLHKVSELLYDWSNGQATLGDVNIYHDRKKWLDAHIRIQATNRLRPWAAQGGIISEPKIDPEPLDATKVITYTPGQIRMGSVWNRYGSQQGNPGQDWPQALAHELGHYIFFLDDNYLGFNDDGLLIPVENCPGAMGDPHDPDHSEFLPDQDWLPACEQTLSNRLSGRSDWSTIQTFYSDLHAPPPVNLGPSNLPLAVTNIQIRKPVTSTQVLNDAYFYITAEGGGRERPATAPAPSSTREIG